MFRKCSGLALVVISLPCLMSGAAIEADNVAAEYHFAGKTNLAAINKIFALPAEAEAREIVLDRISLWLAGGLNFGTNASAISLLEPLLSDVLATESLGSFGGAATNPLDFVLALRLDAKRAQLWQDNLAREFGGPGEKFTADEFDGWRWNRGATDSFWIVPARGWLIVGRGNEFLALRTEYLQQVKQQGRPAPPLQANWLEAEMDWARLTAWLPEWARLLKPARIKISVAGEQDNLRLTARMIYPQAIPWRSGSWQIPADLVQSPLDSLTAAQNVAAYLNLSPAFSRLDGDPLTNQFYVWAWKEFPLLTFMAWPVANATNTLEKLATEAAAAFSPDLKQFNGTELLWQGNRKRLVLSNLRVVLPTLEAVQAKAGDFLLCSVFAHLPMKQPAPDEVWEQIKGRTNLVYYDWEKTGSRSQDWRTLGRLFLVRQGMPTDDTITARAAADKWISQLAAIPGNTVTEITRVAPNELSVVRISPVGFTGVEMFLLWDWLSSIGSPPINPRPPAH
jgi:hypothetical protein